jgi:hypothetical protein
MGRRTGRRKRLASWPRCSSPRDGLGHCRGRVREWNAPLLRGAVPEELQQSPGDSREVFGGHLLCLGSAFPKRLEEIFPAQELRAPNGLELVESRGAYALISSPVRRKEDGGDEE